MKKLNIGNIILALGEIAVGILLLIIPDDFSEKSITVLGVVVAAMGLFDILNYVRRSPEEVTSMLLTRAFLELLAGLFCVFRADWFTENYPLMPTIYGLGMMVLGVQKLAQTFHLLRLHRGGWPWKLGGGLLTVIFAVIVLVNPFSDGTGLWIFLGIALLAEGIVDVVAMVLMHRRIVAGPSDPDDGPGEELVER